jgi:hypothetical protein
MKKILQTALIAIMLILPAGVSATTSFPTLSVVVPKNVGAGDTVLIPIMLDVPETSSINSLQARISVSGSARLVNFSTGGSVFTLWPEGPTVSGNNISFVGGTPGSVYGSPLRVLTLAVTATNPGTVKIIIVSATAYAGDGKGTSKSLKEATFSFKVGAKSLAPHDEFSKTILKDTAVPDPFNINIGRDPSLYNNAYFISFGTSDAGSGVRTYEVKENDGPWISATSTYLLTDQSLTGNVLVRAVDAAGNARTEMLTFKSNTLLSGSGLWITLVLLIAIVVFWYVRKRRRVE